MSESGGRRTSLLPTPNQPRRGRPSRRGTEPSPLRVGGEARAHRLGEGDHAAERPLPVQVDGDYIGEHDEAVFEALPGALRVVS